MQASALDLKSGVVYLDKSLTRRTISRVLEVKTDPKSGVVHVSYDSNKNDKVDFMNSYKDSILIYQKIDRNEDGEFDYYKEIPQKGEILSREMKDRNFDKKMDYIRTVIQNPGSDFNVTIRLQKDDKFNGDFSIDYEVQSSILQAASGGGPINHVSRETACLQEYMMPLGKSWTKEVNQIKDALTIFKDDNYLQKYMTKDATKVRIKYDKNCTDKGGLRPDFESEVGAALSEGLSCMDQIARSAEDPRKSNMAQVNVVSGLATLMGSRHYQNKTNGFLNKDGSAPDKRRRGAKHFGTALTFVCSGGGVSNADGRQNGCVENRGGIINKLSAVTDAMASTGRGKDGAHGLQCGQVKHPFIYFDPNGGMADVKKSEFKEKVFHEFIHNMGFRHKVDIDYAKYCGICCFNEAYKDSTLGSREFKSADAVNMPATINNFADKTNFKFLQQASACKICRGSYADGGADDSEYKKDIENYLKEYDDRKADADLSHQESRCLRKEN